MQPMWQLTVSAPVPLALSPLLGPWVREPRSWHLAGGASQVSIASGGFLSWPWLLTIHPTAGAGSLSFLTPILGVALGWRILGESVGPRILVPAALVAGGLVLVNRPVGASVAVAPPGAHWGRRAPRRALEPSRPPARTGAVAPPGAHWSRRALRRAVWGGPGRAASSADGLGLRRAARRPPVGAAARWTARGA